MPLGPLDWTGGPFLQLYAVLFVAAFAAGIIVPRWLRADGRAGRPVDADALAYLAGGPTRMAESSVAGAIAAGQMTVEGRSKLALSDARAARGTLRALAALDQPMRWGAVQRALARDAVAIDQRLVDDELLIDMGATWRMRVWQTLPYLLLIGFGLLKYQIGVERDRPVGILTVFLVATAVVALVRFAVVDRRTRAGLRALQDARTGADRLRRAPAADEAALAVALFGTTVLAGSGWEDFHRLRTDGSDGGSGDSGSSGSDGGSGCGGGGCGGCGS